MGSTTRAVTSARSDNLWRGGNPGIDEVALAEQLGVGPLADRDADEDETSEDEVAEFAGIRRGLDLPRSAGERLHRSDR